MKVICIGRNYAEHAAELGDEPPTEPLIFGKFENTLIGPGDAIVLPPEATHVDSEAELAVEIGRQGHRIPAADALDYVRGYRVANDVSARNIQYAESQWTRAKGFDTFCPLSTELVPVSELGNGSGLHVLQRLPPFGLRLDTATLGGLFLSAQPVNNVSGNDTWFAL